MPSRDWDGIGGRFSGRCSANIFWPFLGKPEVVAQRVLEFVHWFITLLVAQVRIKHRKEERKRKWCLQPQSPGGHQISLSRSATHVAAESHELLS